MRVLALLGAALALAPSCTTGISLTLTASATEAEPAVDVASASEPAITTTTTTTVPSRAITLGFAGDMHMVNDLADRDPLGQVTELLSAPDLTFVNLETVVGDAAEVGPIRADKPFNFRSPPVTLDLLLSAGIDVVGLANNHSFDHGSTGATVTAERVRASGLVGVGVGATPQEAYAPAFIDVEGYTVGVVSLSRVPCDWASDPKAERLEVAWACDRFALGSLASVAEAAAASDVTVLMLHGGVELTDCPGPRLREIVATWVGMGVDIVSISHPHVLQGVEIVGGAPVLWSTGNFVFTNNGGRTGRSALFEVTVTSEGEPLVQLRPTELPSGVARPAEGDAAGLVLAEVTDRSPGGSVVPDGLLHADPAPSRCD